MFVAASRHPRSLPAGELAALFDAADMPAVAADTPAEALEQAQAEAGPSDLVLATGSIFLAAEVREAFLGIEPEIYPDLLPTQPR